MWSHQDNNITWSLKFLEDKTYNDNTKTNEPKKRKKSKANPFLLAAGDFGPSRKHWVITPKPSMAAYNAFKPNSTTRIFDEISHLLMKKTLTISK